MIPKIESVTESLTSIRDLASESSVSRQMMRRWILRLHRSHGGKWLFRVGRSYVVNRELLKAEHPEVFAHPRQSVAEIELLREEQKGMRRDLNALAARVRELGNEVKKRCGSESSSVK